METATENEDNTSQLPEGFTPLSVTGQQNWVSKSPGVIVRGIIKGRFKRNNPDPKKKDTYFYQVQVTGDSVEAIFNKDEVTVERGEIVCIDETKALEPLADLITEPDVVYEVFVRYIEKVPNQRDPRTSFWRTEVGYKKLEGTDIPF